MIKKKLRKRERHGMRWTPLYIVWLDMTARCRCENHKNYPKYGGRGIYVCDEWKNSFIAFFNDMGSTYSKGLDIDRVDNDGPYCKENCRWVSKSINCANRRNFGKYMKGVVGKTRGGKKFISRITIYGVKYSIGAFEKEIDAHNAFMEVHREWYGF